MSENPEPPQPKVRVHRSRTKRKFIRSRLPTPPPDPKAYEDALEQSGSPEDATSDKDKEFLEYISALQKSPQAQLSRSDSLFAPVAVTEDAFDHLDRLYKLMEQMLNLRQQNARLQLRLKDLEHLKNLQSLHRQVDNSVLFEDIPELDDDSSLAESLLDAMLTKKETKPKPWTRSRIRQSLMRKQRNRSSSLNDRGIPLEAENVEGQRRASAGSDREKSAKVSKWTKVKAAFRWEKASPSVSGAKSQDSGIGGMLPVNYEVARYLRVPSTSDETGISPADSGAADGSTPGTLSSASSADDIHRSDHRGVHGDLQGSDDDRHSITLDGTHLTKSASSSDSSRPMWVRMKSKIPSCSNVPEKNRLSVRSDDMKMDTSDNEDLLENRHHEGKKLVKQNSRGREKQEIPPAVIARYREVVAEDETMGKQNFTPKRISKWTRVKKAFLTPAINSTNHKHGSDNASHALILGTKKDVHMHKHEDESKRIQDEIQRNYRQLQKKLSLEFQGKLQEWEKLKSSGSSNVSGAHSRCDGSLDDQRDHAFMKKMEEWQRIKAQPLKPGQNVPMIREENLAPEFKKKLEEWQKIKKCGVKDDSSPVTKNKKKLGEWPKWKSVSGHREEHGPAENQQLSEEFLKKLEEWRKMKRHDEAKDRSPSPKPSRKHTEPSTSGHCRKPKEQDQKELHWFEKELNKIEKQKQRLEQERQKFLQREERLTKLRRTVLGDGNKKDILIHTPSGFYRFEGISRKFTQKLCEWEKAQGIGPEASTFALLTSTFTPHITVDLYETDPHSSNYGSSRLLRSKSAESLASPNSIQPGPSTSHHPSSLSLNDVEELEKQCLSLSRASSVQDMDGSLEKLRSDEPEAVIVEVEDVVEETASALEERLEEKHFPIYQREVALNTCEEQPCVIPYLQRNDSKCAQYSCFLIEEVIKLLRTIEDEEDKSWESEYQPTKSDEIDKEESSDEFEQQSPCSPDILKNKDKNKLQKQRSDTVLEKIIHLQDIHSKNISDVAADELAPTSSHFSNLMESAQDLFSELFQLAEQLQNAFYNRSEECSSTSYFKFDYQFSNVSSIISELMTKLTELKRILSYFYAASDLTAPGRKLKSIKKSRPDLIDDAPLRPEKIKRCSSTGDISNISHNQNKQGQLVAKRMRYRKKDYSSKTLRDDENEENDAATECKNISINNEKYEMVTVDPVLIEKLVIPTKTNYVNVSCEPSPSCITEVNPADVFVKTTRKVFTPLTETQHIQPPSESPSCSSVDLSVQNRERSPQKECSDNDTNQAIITPVARLPPLPISPTPQRKASKEISPSIRLMLAKYTQMISKQETPTTMSAASSGSASPVAWRSPVSERRVKAQRERYLEELSRIDPRSEVKKSASVSILNSDERPEVKAQSCSILVLPTENSLKVTKGILRSTSTSVINTPVEKFEQLQKYPPLKLVIPENTFENTKTSPELRYSKLQRAKEEFLNSPVPSPISAPPLLPGHENVMKYPVRSRFSQISMGSESSCDSSPYEGLLVKSASAGMINVDEDTYQQIDPAFHREGYVSLPRSVAKQKEGLLGGKLSLSNIAAKFRKVKMRRTKDQKKMNTVSALCRQSLVVDINPTNPEGSSQERQARSDSLTVPSERAASSSEDTSPSSSRSGSWIRRSRIFKAL